MVNMNRFYESKGSTMVKKVLNFTTMMMTKTSSTFFQTQEERRNYFISLKDF